MSNNIEITDPNVHLESAVKIAMSEGLPAFAAVGMVMAEFTRSNLSNDTSITVEEIGEVWLSLYQIFLQPVANEIEAEIEAETKAEIEASN